jgi:hypothetical protein
MPVGAAGRSAGHHPLGRVHGLYAMRGCLPGCQYVGDVGAKNSYGSRLGHNHDYKGDDQAMLAASTILPTAGMYWSSRSMPFPQILQMTHHFDIINSVSTLRRSFHSPFFDFPRGHEVRHFGWECPVDRRK